MAIGGYFFDFSFSIYWILDNKNKSFYDTAK